MQYQHWPMMIAFPIGPSWLTTCPPVRLSVFSLSLSLLSRLNSLSPDSHTIISSLNYTTFNISSNPSCIRCIRCPSPCLTFPFPIRLPLLLPLPFALALPRGLALSLIPSLTPVWIRIRLIPACSSIVRVLFFRLNASDSDQLDTSPVCALVGRCVKLDICMLPTRLCSLVLFERWRRSIGVASKTIIYIVILCPPCAITVFTSLGSLYYHHHSSWPSMLFLFPIYPIAFWNNRSSR